MEVVTCKGVPFELNFFTIVSYDSEDVDLEENVKHMV